MQFHLARHDRTLHPTLRLGGLNSPPVAGLAIKVLLRLLVLLGLTPMGVAAASVDVRIQGVTGSVLRNVEAHLAILELEGRSDSPSVAEIRRLHRRAPEDIEAALQALGYYHGTVGSSLVKVSEDVASSRNPVQRAGRESLWIAEYRINRGEPTRWRHLRLELIGEASADPAIDAELQMQLPVVGKRVHHGRYDEARDDALETLVGEGYLDAAYMRSVLRVDRPSHAADIDWLIDSGERFEFGEISVEQSILDPGFVTRYVNLRPGETFDARRLADLQLRLGASGYFSEVRAEVHRQGQQGRRVPVTLVAAPANSKFFRVGAGYGTDTGPRLTFGAEFRRLNDSGHRLRMDLRAATVRSSAGVEYLIPWRDVTTDLATVYGRIDRGDIGDAESDQYTIGIRFEDAWVFGLRRAVYVQFSHESFQFDGEPGRQADLLIPGISLTFQRGDDLLFTRRGFSASLDVHAGSAGVVSDTSFVYAALKSTMVLPLGKTSRLILRGGLGAVEAGEFNALPPSQRFFIGGDRTLRGYAFESVSTESRTGLDIGGSRFFSQSVEADKLVWKNFGVAAFYDQGGAGRSVFGTRKQSVGVGFRWRSPVGMLRVDVAHPLDGSGGVRFHLGLGPDL